jgi:hypothetical protein
MDAERMRAMLLKLPHVAETEAWSTYVLFWAADKSIGGKLFAMMNPVNETNGVITYAAGPERYAELLEREGVSPSVEFPVAMGTSGALECVSSGGVTERNGGGARVHHGEAAETDARCACDAAGRAQAGD